MFSAETPSRLMRRIDELEHQEDGLAELPPALDDDADYTTDAPEDESVRFSSAAASESKQRSPAGRTPTALSPRRTNNNTGGKQVHVASTPLAQRDENASPFTSTPAKRQDEEDGMTTPAPRNAGRATDTVERVKSSPRHPLGSRGGPLKGTPHPLRQHQSMLSSTDEEDDDDEEDEQDERSSDRVTSNGATSNAAVDGSPSAATSSAHVNSADSEDSEQADSRRDSRRVLHLETELDRLRGIIAERDHELERARSMNDTHDDDRRARIERDLRDQLAQAHATHEAALQRARELEEETAEREKRHELTVQALHERADSLYLELETLEGLKQQIQGELEAQESDFAAKMEALEQELTRIMDGYERRLRDADALLESNRREQDSHREDQQRKMEQYQELVDELRRELERREHDRSEMEHSRDVALLRAESNADDRVAELESRVQELEQELDTRHERLEELEQVVKARDGRVAQLEQQVDAERRRATDLEGERERVQELEARLAKQPAIGEVQASERRARDELAQAESALNESENQMLRYESELEQARQQLAGERTRAQNLNAQLNQLNAHKAKASSPLINELSVSSVGSSMLHGLQDELDGARQELEKANAETRRLEAHTEALERDLDEANAAHDAGRDALRAEIESLKSHVRELEQQRHGEDMNKTPSPFKRHSRTTPDKSVTFKPVVRVRTPITPGHVLANFSGLSSVRQGSPGNQTIAPLYNEIEDMGHRIDGLRSQVEDNRKTVGDRIGLLEPGAAAPSTLRTPGGTTAQDLRDELDDARATVQSLEKERDELLEGVQGLQEDLQRVKEHALALGDDFAEAVRARQEADSHASEHGAELARLESELAGAREHVQALSQARRDHRKEAKGLVREIEYLQALVARGVDFRNMVVYQKRYLEALTEQKQAT